MLIESGSAEVVCRYSDPCNTSYGNAQSLYAYLVAHHVEGIQGKARIQTLEEEIDVLRHEGKWNKTITNS